ncbi:MAG TPA: amino acid ABC transporter permease [Acetobacteraceae bacterium]|jgi:His/Glu/Gln/Arg/opine family amino acid ABC transporter permease subunit|nr:amino acid ABC transporter permease [Acetobacteraceae bacterium]
MTAQIWIWRGLVAATCAAAVWLVGQLDWARVIPSWQFLLLALGRSWWLAIVAMGFGLVAAVPLALLRVYGAPWPRRVAALVIEAVRATPELMIIFWVYFTLPVLTGSQVSAWDAALGSLSVIAAVYLAEVVRAGLYSVPGAQREAAYALGLTRFAAFRLVVLPQALRNMLPALIAQLVSLFKTTSLVYAIGVMDFFRAVSVTNSAVFAPYPLYLVLGAGYFLSCWIITRVVRRFDPGYQLAE